MHNRFKVYCGPTIVHQLAELLRNYRVEVTCEGTEHVYVKTWMTQAGLHTALREMVSGIKYTDIMPCPN